MSYWQLALKNFLIVISMLISTCFSYAEEKFAAQCSNITPIILEVIRMSGKENLSEKFKQSLRGWLAEKITCDGPGKIFIYTENDAIAFTHMRDSILAAYQELDIQKSSKNPHGLDVIIENPSLKKLDMTKSCAEIGRQAEAKLRMIFDDRKAAKDFDDIKKHDNKPNATFNALYCKLQLGLHKSTSNSPFCQC